MGCGSILSCGPESEVTWLIMRHWWYQNTGHEEEKRTIPLAMDRNWVRQRGLDFSDIEVST